MNTQYYNIILSSSVILLLAILVSALNSEYDKGNNENLGLHGHFVIDAYHSDGTLFYHTERDNLVVTNGLKGIANLAFNANSGLSPSTYRYLALGSSSTAVSASDTALNSECGYSRQLTSSPTYSSAVITLTGTFTGATCTVNEIGIFDASSSGNMFSHALTGAFTMGSADTINVTYTITES